MDGGCLGVSEAPRKTTCFLRSMLPGRAASHCHPGIAFLSPAHVHAASPLLLFQSTVGYADNRWLRQYVNRRLLETVAAPCTASMLAYLACGPL